MSESQNTELSVEQYRVLEIIQEAVTVDAEDVRFTGYRPSDEVSIRFKLPTANGRPNFLNSSIHPYREGSRLVRTVLEDFCDWPGSLDFDQADGAQAELRPEFAARLGIRHAGISIRRLRDRGDVGFIAVLTFTGARPSPTRPHAG